jgi:amylosucrase
MQFHETGNDHLLVFERGAESAEGILVLANFDEVAQVVNTSLLGALGFLRKGTYQNLIDGKTGKVKSGLLELAPADLLWLRKF